MRVRHSQIASYIGANPVGDIGLVHRVDVDLVLAWSRLVEIPRLSLVLHSERELGVLAAFVFWSSRISEVEVTSGFVRSWPWHSQVLDSPISDFSMLPDVLIFDYSSFSVSCRVAECALFELIQLIGLMLSRILLPLESIAWVLRRILPRANRVFRWFLPCLASQTRLDNDETWNRRAVFRLVHSWPRYSIVFFRFINLLVFASQHRLRLARLDRFRVVVAWSWRERRSQEATRGSSSLLASLREGVAIISVSSLFRWLRVQFAVRIRSGRVLRKVIPRSSSLPKSR